jgi:hypothetical protein
MALYLVKNCLKNIYVELSSSLFPRFSIKTNADRIASMNNNTWGKNALEGLPAPKLRGKSSVSINRKTAMPNQAIAMSPVKDK